MWQPFVRQNLGKKTALIEADFLGGTCLNRGCIPSKTYLKHSEIIEQIESEGLGNRNRLPDLLL